MTEQSEVLIEDETTEVASEEETLPTEETPEGEIETEAPKQSRSQNAKQRLRRKLHEEQQLRFEAEERAKELETKFSTIEQKLDTVINPPPPRPSRVDFESEEEYEDSLFEWRDHSKPTSPVSEPEPQVSTRQEAVDPVAPEVRKNWVSQLETAADKYDDFDEKLVSIPKESMSDPMTFAIMESEQGGEIAYFLGENHAEADRISRLPLTAQVREIDKLGNKFKSTISMAPTPITPTTGGDSPTKDPAKMSPEEWRDYRRKGGMPN